MGLFVYEMFIKQVKQVDPFILNSNPLILYQVRVSCKKLTALLYALLVLITLNYKYILSKKKKSKINYLEKYEFFYSM